MGKRYDFLTGLRIHLHLYGGRTWIPVFTGMTWRGTFRNISRPSFWRAYPPMFVADLPADGWDKRKIYLPPIFGGIPK
ncbi:MAG TPA: hypothetical protein PLQ82_13755, partial [Desulfobacteraceae bacterium]|nr:hypothetical protein [Desulfobacteraceae bacterium]